MTEIQERLAGLSPEKLKLLARRLGRRHGQDLELPPVVADPAARYEPFPLTEVQHAYWMGRSTLYELGGVSAHGYQEIDVQGLDPARFEHALRQVIERHDMLRMVILPSGEQQVLAEVEPYRIEVLDLRGRPRDEAERELAALRERLSHQVLAADEWPLFDIRASLLDDGLVRIHISFDILVADLASYQILLADLAAYYADPAAGLPPVELTFRDYVMAVERLRESPLAERAWGYWRERLETIPPGPQLPLARDPATVRTPRFRRRDGSLAPEDWSRLREKARQIGITPSGLLLAAFAEVLGAWSKEPRFTINLTLFNRLPLHPQVNHVVGDFTSLTLLAVDRDAGRGFAERARLSQEQLWRDLEHSFVGGVSLMRELARRNGGAQPRMPVVFTSSLAEGAAQPRRGAAAGGDGLLGETVYSISQTPQVWLDHQVWERQGALGFNWDAIEELFPPGLLDAMFAAYLRLLEDLVAGEGLEPRRPLLPEHQRALREAIGATAAPLPREPLHAPFAHQAQRAPERVAVQTAERAVSYGELYRRAAHLAARLGEEQVAHGEPVAVVLEKGWLQVVAVLGVLGAGAAYLPIDPALPAARVRRLLERGGCRVAIVAPTGPAGGEEGLDGPRLDGPRLDGPRLDGPWPAAVRPLPLTGGPQELAPREATLDVSQELDRLAYVLFTSGSTGEPKGVMIDHRGAANTLLDVNRRHRIGAGDRVLGVSSLSFDLSVWDIFGVLGAGGTLVLPEPAARRDPARWLELMRTHGVTVWNSVPALMQMLVEHAAAAGGAGEVPLRLVLLSGDWIPLPLPGRIHHLWPRAAVWSLGGATEASIWSIRCPVEEVDPQWPSIPYGRPMDNQSFHVLDSRLEPRPDWVPGELFIGGVGLAHGYWRDAERTAASFLVHPATGERLYRTGDLGRFLPSGDIELLGREDHQVKIQGHRVELGEIEAALEAHPEVRDAVVVAVGERTHRRLAAFVVPAVPASQASASQAPTAHPYELEQIEFRLGEHGLRRDLGAAARRVELERPAAGAAVAAFARRRTHRRFSPRPVALERLSHLLACLVREEAPGSPLPRALYPSAGTLYPVQVYLHARPGRVEGLDGGFYYHHPRQHRLLHLEPGDLPVEVHAQVNRPTYESCAFSLFLVAALDAIEPVYGEWSSDFCLLEAGAVTQLLMTVAPEAGLGLCPVGRLEVEPVARALGLGERHRLLHTVLGGGAAREEDTAPAAPGDPAEQLRAHLEERLPAYMVPGVVLRLASLPLTANGKVDRAALARIAEGQPGAGEPPVAPRTAVEQTLVGLWRDLLRDPEIGVRDDFFARGGDSILAIRFLTAAREAGLEITPQQFFERTTVEGLAALFDRRTGAEAAEAEPPAGAAPPGDRAASFTAAEMPDEDLDELLSSFGGEDEE